MKNKNSFRFPDWSKIETLEQAHDVILKIVESIGFSGAVFSYTPIGLLPGHHPGLIKCAMQINVPSRIFDNWLTHHNLNPAASSKMLSHSADPMRKTVLDRILPISFDVRQMVNESGGPDSSKIHNFLKALLSLGVEQVYSVPVYSIKSEYWSLGLVRYNDNPVNVSPSEEDLACLQWLATNIAEFCSTKLGWRTPGDEWIKRPITPRETDCLLCAAKGMTSIETAEHLGIGTETVRKYLKNATSKLGARNKPNAVSIAHQLGLLSFNI